MSETSQSISISKSSCATSLVRGTHAEFATGVSGIVLVKLLDVLRRKLLRAQGEEEECHEFCHLCTHFEHEIVAFYSGLLVSQCVRFAIVGSSFNNLHYLGLKVENAEIIRLMNPA